MNDNGNDGVSPDPALYFIMIEPTYVGILGHSGRCAHTGSKAKGPSYVSRFGHSSRRAPTAPADGREKGCPTYVGLGIQPPSPVDSYLWQS